MEARNRAFEQLKPACVRLSESALKLMGRSGDVKEVIQNLKQLQKVLTTVSVQLRVLDTKLAEYVFFPLSSVLKQLEKMPLTARELAFECLFILLRTAWSREIAPELGMQLLILYSFIADQKGDKTSEELQTVVFQSMKLVLTALGHDEKGRNALVSSKMVPHLGKAVSVILDGIIDGPSEPVQSAAISALDAICRSVPDRDALAISFLPGVMSCLTKVLTPKAGRISSNVLSSALDVLSYLIPHLFNDNLIQSLPESTDIVGNKGLSGTWVKATAPQVKMALSNIIKLQQHGRQNVRIALGKFCAVLLQDCSKSLADSTSMLLETIVTVASQDEAVEVEVRHLLAINQDSPDTLKSSLHYWIISLPRIMESADETKKHRRIRQITLAFRLLNEQGLDMTIINIDLAKNLRDSVANAIKDPKNGNQAAAVELPTSSSLELIRGKDALQQTFSSVMSPKKSQEDIINELSQFVQQLSAHESGLATAQDLVASLDSQSGDMQLATFWLSLNLVRSALHIDLDMDSYVNLGNEALDVKSDMLEQLYDFSISILSERSLTSGKDWRLQALALETIALQASQLKGDFQDELIDALYLVLHYLGSSVPSLQAHAMTCLNILANSCGYKNPGELIVANVDYLVNAVALRLNTFDISPQAPQVLLMMVKLAGPPLLPYLDDTVDSIFIALESFHGYPMLVDLLFSALKAIVQEGAKSSQLALTSLEDEKSQQKNPLKRIRIEELVVLIEDLKTKYAALEEEETGAEGFPEQPWTTDDPGYKDEDETPKEPIPSDNDPQPPAPRTYSLLLNISELTQHYLTSSSSELRTSLLDLLSVSFPALAKHENSFLPLIHTLWPVLLPRLEDPEPYVVAGSLNIIGIMCKYAGNFLSGRIEEAWLQIKKLYSFRTGRAGDPQRRTERGSASSKDIIIGTSVRITDLITPVGHHYVDAPSRIIWDALVSALINIVSYVATNDSLFDEIVVMLAPVVSSRPEVREALNVRNADAVWLALWRLESTSTKSTMARSQDFTPAIAPLAVAGWQFAPLL